MSSEAQSIYEFGPFRLDVTEHRLLRDGRPVPLPPKVFETLLLLVQRSGHVVEKDEIMKVIWPDSFVEEANLTQYVFALRRALGEAESGEPYIETVPKHGYRFVADVREIVVETLDPEIERPLAKPMGDNGSGELRTVRPPPDDARWEAEPQRVLDELSERRSHSPHLAAQPLGSLRGRNGLFLSAGLAVLLLASGFFAYRNIFPDKQIESIAVMPFQNASASADAEYLSDGISEALINSLSELQQLKVIARSTTFRYKGKETDPQTVGRELNVEVVLMGRVRQVGDSLNVQVDLVDASTGAQLWGKEYERPASDVLSVKRAITREVTDNLKLRLSGEQQQQLTKRDATNAEAYQSYLRGRYYWNRRTAANITKALDQFQQAVDKDPTSALAYVGLADSYAVLEQYAGRPSSETLPKAKAAAMRALEIDDSLAEAYASLGFINQQSWQFDEAERNLKRAMELDPDYPTARQWYARHLNMTGRFDEAFVEIKRAQQLDPLSPIISFNVAHNYLIAGDINTATEQFKNLLEINPNFPQAHDYLGLIYLKQGREREAIDELQKGVEASKRASDDLSFLGYGYAVLGKRAEAMTILKELEQRHDRQESAAVYLAAVHAGLGDKDKAFSWLEKGFEARSGLLVHITYRPVFDTLRSDPRYADLVRRIGLTS